jgi:hypothetical protein
MTPGLGIERFEVSHNKLGNGRERFLGGPGLRRQEP